MREASSHPFVAQAVTLFDASIRRVDRRPPRAQPAAPQVARTTPAEGDPDGTADER